MSDAAGAPDILGQDSALANARVALDGEVALSLLRPFRFQRHIQSTCIVKKSCQFWTESATMVFLIHIEACGFKLLWPGLKPYK